MKDNTIKSILLNLNMESIMFERKKNPPPPPPPKKDTSTRKTIEVNKNTTSSNGVITLLITNSVLSVLSIILLIYFIGIVKANSLSMLELIEQMIPYLESPVSDNDGRLSKDTIINIRLEQGTPDKSFPTTVSSSIKSVEYYKRPVTTRKVSDIRKDDFGTKVYTDIEIEFHPGGEEMDEEKLRNTICHIISSMPNLKYDVNLEELIFETFLVESRIGGCKLTPRASSGNYGVGQVRVSSAKDVLSFLKRTRIDVYETVMFHYDNSKSFKENITHNIPFTIALVSQYYWQRVPDIYSNIETLRDRANIWKAVYNTKMGSGTIFSYMKKAAGRA